MQGSCAEGYDRILEKEKEPGAMNSFPNLKRGRPRKDIDVGVMFHMLKNNAPITAVARHMGIHRDTLYANFQSVIEEARAAYREAWKKIADEMFNRFLERKRLKEEAKRKKRRYRGCFCCLRR